MVQPNQAIAAAVRAVVIGVALCLVAWLSVSCRKNQPEQRAEAQSPTPTPQLTAEDPIQSRLKAIAEAIPLDLEVGSGDGAISVRRHWRSTETLETKFGPGWGDDNVVQLTQFDRDALLISRGGTGWRLAHRDGKNFKTPGGDEVERRPNGWFYQSRDKASLEFDPGGRLQRETTALGAVRTYSYDASGRLNKVSGIQSQTIQYKYDAAGRVASVEGSNNQRATYQYDNGRLSQAAGPMNTTRFYQYDTAAGLVAKVRIVGAVPAVSAGAQTVAVGVETVVAPVPAATTAALSNLVRVTGVVGTTALTAVAVVSAASEFKKWSSAATEAKAAQAAAKSLKSALENKLIEVLQKEPAKLMPLPSGHTPDPKNPDHLAQLLIQLHANVTNEKPPFEGIVVTSPNDEQIEAALKRARQIIGQTYQLRRTADPAMARALELDGEAFQELRKVGNAWNARARLGALEEFLKSAETVTAGTQAVQTASEQLAALEAELQAAISRCEEGATTACAAAGAAPNSGADASAQREKFASLVKQLTGQVAAAKEKINALEVVTGDTLRDQVVELVTHASQISAGIEVVESKEWLEVSKAVRNLAEQRKVAEKEAKNALDMIEANRELLKETLAPFHNRPEAIALTSEMEGLAATLLEPFSEWAKATDQIKMLQAVEEQARKGQAALTAANVDSLNSAAGAALDQLTKNRTAVATLVSDTRAEQALARANACVGQIQEAPAVAQASPSASGSPASDEVTVPNLSVFESVLEMKAGLANLGLNGALVAAKDKPPSKEKEFKFAGQEPAPGTKVKPGSTVSIAFYQKFEGPEPAASDADDIVGHWAGTMSFRKTKDPIAFDIQRQGSGYVLINKAENKPTPATYSGGKLLAVSKSAIKSAGLTQAATIHIELTREGETLSGTLVIEAADGSRGAPVQLLLTRQSK